MAITLPPKIPNRNDPANFAADTDAFLAWLATFVTEFNAQAYNGGLADGTVDLPSLYFNDRRNTGMFRQTNGRIAMSLIGSVPISFGQSSVELSVPLRGPASEIYVNNVNASGTSGLGSIASPTIMDYNTNANGEYWRFLNGLCIQSILIPAAETLAINNAAGTPTGIFSANPIQKTWPLGGFMDGTVSACISSLHQVGWVDCNFSNAGRWNFTARSYVNTIAAGAYSIRAVSVGKWK